jgi:4'-phosphopantetheinyl transferase
LVISNIETVDLPPNTFFSFSSALIILRCWLSCRLFFLMYAQIFLVTSVRGCGWSPTTAARSASGFMAFMNAGFGARLAPVFFAAFFVAFLAVAFFAVAFFAVAFLAVAFLAVAFFAVVFFAVAFFAVFFAGDFFAAVLRAGAFFAAVLRAGDFLAAAFLAGAFLAAFFGAAFFAAGFLTAAFLPDFFVGAIDGLRQRVSGQAQHPTGRCATKMNRPPSVRNNKICETQSGTRSVITARTAWTNRRGTPNHRAGHPGEAMTMRMNYLVHDGEADVWTLSLEAGLSVDPALCDCLSPGERARADAMTSAEARHAFTMVRAVLRGILAGYTGAPPEALPLRTTAAGKPVLTGAGFDFSVSHTRGAAVIVVADTEVGVDIERLGRPHDPIRIARRVMHAETIAALEELPPVLQAAVFVDAWAQREAHVKAVGGGLLRTPDTLPFRVTQPDGVFAPVRDRLDHGHWSVARFTPVPGTRAAVVAAGELGRLRIRDATPILQQRGSA